MDRRFSGAQREIVFDRLQKETFDALVIGGGITGAGIALDAQTRGMKTALIEMQDFAAGASSRSTKLIHGGLRYLKQLEVKMVAEIGKERAVVYENGPHVTTPVWMLLPFYKGGALGALSTSIGLKIYDYLAGVKPSERRIMLDRNETLQKEPLLKEHGLKGGGYYVEYRTDDARLTIEVLKKAADFGAAAVNYTKAEQFLYEDGKLRGVIAADCMSGRRFPIRALRVVNATGPWVDTLREPDSSKQGKTVRLTKGVHLVFDAGRFPLRQAVYFDTADGRMVFAIPRDGKTYVGTTDTDYSGDLAHPAVTKADRDYILRVIQDQFPSLRLTEDDVESSWAGLRPLVYQEGKSPSDISRRDEIFQSGSGLITIAGGKLTGYRKMAETVTDLLARELVAEGRGPYRMCVTKTLPISGGDVGGSASFSQFVKNMTEEGVRLGLSADASEQLARRYGSNVSDIYDLIPTIQEDAARWKLPVELCAPLLYGIEREMATKPVDFFIRRTGALFFDIGSVRRWKHEVIGAMSEYLRYTEEQTRQYTEDLDRHLRDAAP